MLFNQLKDKTRDVGLLADNLNLQAKLLLNHEAIIKSLKKRLAQYHRRCISTEKRLEDLKKGTNALYCLLRVPFYLFIYLSIFLSVSLMYTSVCDVLIISLQNICGV